MFRKYYHEANDEINSEELLSRILKNQRKIPVYRRYSAIAAAVLVMAVSVSSFSFIKDRQSEKNGFLPQNTPEAVLENKPTSTPMSTIIPTEQPQNTTKEPIAKSEPTEEVYYVTDTAEKKQTVKVQTTNPPVTDVPVTQPPNTQTPTVQPTQPPITNPPETTAPEEEVMNITADKVEESPTQRPSAGGGSGGGSGGASSSSLAIKPEAMIDVMVEIGVGYPKDGEMAQVNGVTVYLSYDGDYTVGGFEYNGVSYKITAGNRNDVMKKARSIIQ